MACINPHRLGLAGALESALAVEFYRPSVSDEHVLVKTIVTSQEHLHQARPNAALLILWKHKQVWVVNDEVAVRDGVAQSDKLSASPSRDQRMRGQQRLAQQLWFFRGRPTVGAVK